MQEGSSEGAYLAGSNIHPAAGPDAALLLQRVAVAAVTDLQNGRVKVRPFEGTQPVRRSRTGMRVLSATRPKAEEEFPSVCISFKLMDDSPSSV